MDEFDSRSGEPRKPRDDPDSAHWFAGDAFRGVLTPLLAGLLVDLADLITFGPLGPRMGLLLGGVVGWQLAGRFGMASRPWLPALLAGIYCMMPGTSLMPLATLVASLMRVASPPPTAAAGREPGQPAVPPTIEPEYRASWDDEVTDAPARKDGPAV